MEKKEKYEPIELELVLFDARDVISTSEGTLGGGDDDSPGSWGGGWT